MTATIARLIEGNEKWIARKMAEDPGFFARSAEGQHPRFLWIGCSDSRVPPDEITQTGPGELFVHRNIANLVVPTDLNLLSVLQYSVEVLKVEDIIVCGHYGCGGVNAALAGEKLGLIDEWLAHIREAYQYYEWELDAYAAQDARARRLVELNVLEQINNLGKTSILQKAWSEGSRPALHGWVYELASGRLSVLHEGITNPERLKLACKFERKALHEAAARSPAGPHATGEEDA
jgi:carbonic anhydrase